SVVLVVNRHSALRAQGFRSNKRLAASLVPNTLALSLVANMRPPGTSAARTGLFGVARNEASTGVWVVIAAYNEARAIGRVLAGLSALPYRVLVVDDGSIDATGEVAARAGAEVLRHPINLGQGAALQTGIDYALLSGASHVVTFDADG